MSSIGGPGGIGGPKGPGGPTGVGGTDAPEAPGAVDELAGAEGFAAADRAELKELLTDLVANDPYLAALVGRIQ